MKFLWCRWKVWRFPEITLLPPRCPRVCCPVHNRQRLNLILISVTWRQWLIKANYSTLFIQNDNYSQVVLIFYSSRLRYNAEVCQWSAHSKDWSAWTSSHAQRTIYHRTTAVQEKFCSWRRQIHLKDPGSGWRRPRPCWKLEGLLLCSFCCNQLSPPISSRELGQWAITWSALPETGFAVWFGGKLCQPCWIRGRRQLSLSSCHPCYISVLCCCYFHCFKKFNCCICGRITVIKLGVQVWKYFPV